MKTSCLVILILISFCAQSQNPDLTPQNIKRIDSLLSDYFKNSGAAFLLAKNGSPFLVKGYGTANLELDVPVNSDHKFGIGSISKQFAAVSILLLQKEGKVNIKDDIRTYLPKYNSHGRKITIENILSHTSGIPSYTELQCFDTLVGKKVSNAQLVKVFETPDLLFEPGTNWSYSNSGFVLAALIVEKVSGTPFNDFLKEKIFKRLLMTETTIGTTDFIIPNKTAEYGAIMPYGRLKLEPLYDWYWAYGAGQIVSTVADMLKWDEALYNEEFLPSSLREIAHKTFVLSSNAPANYGLGWAIGNVGDRKLIHHSGAIGGYRAQAARIPQDHLYVVVLSNFATTSTGLITNRILSAIYGIKELKETKAGSNELSAVFGMYESLNAGSRLQSNFSARPAFFSIGQDSSAITYTRSGGTKVDLLPAGKDIFYLKGNPFSQWKLERNANGEPTGLRVSSLLSQFGPERFNKKIGTAPKTYSSQIIDVALLKKYEGVYEYKWGGRTKIYLENGKLKMTDLTSGDVSELSSSGQNKFFVKNQDIEYTFKEGKTGVVGYSYFDGGYDVYMVKVNEIY